MIRRHALSLDRSARLLDFGIELESEMPLLNSPPVRRYTISLKCDYLGIKILTIEKPECKPFHHVNCS